MLYIDFAPTFRKIESFVGNYNKQFEDKKENVFTGRDPGAREKIDDIKLMLRDTHVSLMKRLVECLSSQITKEQKLYGNYDQSLLEDRIFVLRTNNVALAKSIGVSPRTIYNRLQRLLEAGFLTSKDFHGTRSDFKIHINTSCLGVSLNGNPLLLSGVNNVSTTCSKRPEKAGKGSEKSGQTQHISSIFKGEDRKKIVPTEKRYIYKKNKIIRSGEIVEKTTISDILDSFKGNTTNQENPTRQQSFSNKISEKTGDYVPQSGKTTPPVAAAPPKREKISPEVQQYGQILMNFMYATLFSKMHYVAPSQLQASREFLINELSGLDNRELKAKFKELRLRMQLAWEYVQRDPENRYIPNSPAKYFDPSNIHGFSSTKVWHDQFVKDKRKVTAANERALELMERWKLLNKVMDKYLKNPNSTSYFRAKRLLAEKGPEISETFEQLVVYRNNKLTA